MNSVGCSTQRADHISRIVVTAAQMQAIEGRVFAAGMPVAALMEKVAGLIVRRVLQLYPQPAMSRVGVLVGPGHNGGDALVVARELRLRGYEVLLYRPLERLKDLTEAHYRYAGSLGIPTVDSVEELRTCDGLIDGLFGFGLTRSLTGAIADAVNQLNQWQLPIISIDLPSGIHTDTGQPLGTALRATHTLCLGLWKLGLLQEDALAYVGQAELVDFDLPLADIQAVLGEAPSVQRITSEWALAQLPLPRPASTHKYKMGHLLLIAGSTQYIGAAFLSGLGARASGVGMLTLAVPQSLKPSLSPQLPDALVLGCPETAAGAIAQLPDDLDLTRYSAIACGPGLTLGATAVVQQVLQSQQPLVLDADGLNALAQMEIVPTLQARTAATVLTPHGGEFKRLFPDLAAADCRVTATQTAAAQTGAIVLYKGARVIVAAAQQTGINPSSTPALARGGTGDVLTGLIGGLLAQAIAGDSTTSLVNVVQAAAWWHATAGIIAAQSRTQLGVDAHTLTQYLIPALSQKVSELKGSASRKHQSPRSHFE